MRLPIVLVFAAVAGYLSLSQEILWFKVISYGWLNRPTIFGNVLALFLLGVAVGSWAAPRIRERLGWHSLEIIGALTIAAGMTFFGAMTIGSRSLPFSAALGLIILLGGIALVAALMGAVLPLLCDLGASSDARVGRRVSWIYLANVIGSTAGPLLTGFVLLEEYAFFRNIVMLTVAALVAGLAALILAPSRAGSSRGRVCTAVVVATAAIALLGDGAGDRFLERLHLRSAAEPYKYVEEGRSGIAAVTRDDALYGEGIYDGRYTLDPLDDANLIRRAYLVPALHRAPARVLQIGLGSGSWARVLADHRDVHSLTVIEINPAYVRMLANYPVIGTILSDSKVRVHIDDGRQWLVRNPAERFDVIVINTTWHWRAHTTHLLSAEFLAFAKSRLTPGGVMYWNTTGSADVPYTAAGVFTHVVRYGSFVAGSDRPFDMTTGERRSTLARFSGAHAPVLAEPLLSSLASVELPDVAPALRQSVGLWTITENNMATEFKTNGSGGWWRSLPGRIYRPDRAWTRMLFR